MQTIQSIKLPEVLRLVSKPRYVLGTTYTLSLAFFESAIFHEFNRERLKSCLIISDSLGYRNALTEAAALQGAAQDYIVVRAPIPGSFHPKVWLVVGDNEAVLLTGSGNLTQAGFMNNAELFAAVHIKPDSPTSAEMLTDLRSFVTGLANMWRSEDRQELLCVETLTEIDQALAGMPLTAKTETNSSRFLHSFQRPLLEKMPELEKVKELYVAAPFFGDSLQGVDLLANHYPTARLNLFPAIHPGQSINIPLGQFKKSHPQARVSQLSFPAKKEAFAHLKLYGLEVSDGTAWLYCTSANCTQAAWQGPNIEAGLLRTVPRAELAAYFIPSKNKIPVDRLEIPSQGDNSNALHCWAVDTGAGLDLLMSSDHRDRLPLSDVKLVIRAGSGIATCEKPSLFATNCRSHISWTAFEGWSRRRKVAVSVEMSARDAHGHAIHSVCLVENRLLLSADPIHRSAWRGALALLDAEGAPELGDIAAIFSLVDDVFDGNLVLLREVKVFGDGSKPKPETGDEPVSIAIWPPQQDSHELRKKIGSSAHGQLQWFQNILKSLLQNDTTSHHYAPEEHGRVAILDDEQDARNDAQRKVVDRADEKDTADRAEKTAKRLWERAYKDYSRLSEKLKVLCPTPENAPKLWPASIFAFLSTMAVFQAARRMAPNLSLGINAGVLCDDFLRVMFSSRQQPSDYCRPKGHRYHSDEKFPPLADDLCANFKIRPHPDLASVILALVIDRQLRNPALYGRKTGRNQQLELVCDPQFVPSPDIREACCRIWKRYLCDPKGKIVDASFVRDFDNLFNHGTGGAAL
jgi:hypothetical protein